MRRVRLHADQIDTDAALVRRLIERQFPQWADLAITVVESTGTDHDLYRLGDHLLARLPHVSWAAAQPALEAAWLPRLAPHLPFRVPTPMALGRPDAEYPHAWAIHDWLPGESARRGRDDTESIVFAIAELIRALHKIDFDPAPARVPNARTGLAPFNPSVRAAITELGDRIDAAAALRTWQAALEAPVWTGPDVWGHGDLMPGNLLVSQSRVVGIIDFGAVGVGDPAGDLLPAWYLFTGARRATFRSILGVDDGTWQRGRGWALRKAVLALPYYCDTNPSFAALARDALTELLAEP